MRLLALVWLLALCMPAALAQTPSDAPGRTVAVTFDDLPATAEPFSWQAMTDDLLAAIARQGVPAVGFVNEGKLYRDGQLDSGRVALLQQWLDAGLELGNHTFSHRSRNQIPLADYQADVLRGETVTRPLVEEAGQTLRYFRHPFLHTGRSMGARDSLLAFLTAHGYTVAPVTIDNAEWIFARAYSNALNDGDAGLAERVADAYLRYMDATFAFFERQEQEFLGRTMRHVLLLHANRLNADTFDRLAALIRARGYRFVTLDEALEDPAYALPDAYDGPSGISWLHRWALTAGLDDPFFRDHPRAPAFVTEAAGVERE